MSKIIIITRDGNDYQGDEIIAKALSTKEEYPPSVFFIFESLYNDSFYGPENNKYVVKYKEQLRPRLKSLNFSAQDCEYTRDWFNGNISPFSLAIDERIVKVLNKIAEDEKMIAKIQQCKYIEKIKINNNEVYLFYWNRTKGSVTETWRMLALICKDCGIDLTNNTPENNMLYIHDGEWREKEIENKLLIFNHEIQYSSTSSHNQLLEKLKLKFSHIYSFQHNNAEGTIFKDILNCKFGELYLSDLLGEKEKESTTFGILREACINVLTKENKEK